MSASDSKAEVLTIAEAGESVRKTSSVFQQYVQPCLAELFGTSLFVFVGCSSVIGSDAVTPPALAHGLALVVLITVFGPVSGGHFNPAVSLSVCLCGGLKPALLGLYVVAQMLGGMVGAGMTKVLFSEMLYSAAHGAAFSTEGDKLGPATMAEMILTMFLCTVVCMAAVNKSTRSSLAPLCIGLTVTTGIFAGARLSGGCMNPARAFGPAVAAKYWAHHWVYWAGPVCGSLLSAGLIRLLFGDQKTRIVLR
ncbi:aquaporin-8a.1 [Synchiropus splendidus]|uniref:aquaporin-8a.1 n=1 Tax=Synchiropus splendidus TaxID=270530 RepID=UPI00237DA664|nr:aquaporin-8a.1 [Synchiropus splendidus]